MYKRAMVSNNAFPGPLGYEPMFFKSPFTPLTKNRFCVPSQVSDLVSPINVTGRRIESIPNTEVILTCAHLFI
jgi:hypothetical protein